MKKSHVNHQFLVFQISGQAAILLIVILAVLCKVCKGHRQKRTYEEIKVEPVLKEDIEKCLSEKVKGSQTASSTGLTGKRVSSLFKKQIRKASKGSLGRAVLCFSSGK